jgi:large repetitive protein
MKHFNTINKPVTAANFLQHLLRWLRLLVLSLTRIRKLKSKKEITETERNKIIIQPSIKKYIKPTNMSLQRLLIKSIAMLLLIFSGANTMAQGPYPNTGDHAVCVNATEPYGVPLTAGSTYTWTITPVAGGNGTITPWVTPNLITVNWTTVGTATLQVIETNVSGCVGDPVTILITINPIPALVTNNQSACAPGTVDLTAAAVTAGSTAGLTFTYWTNAAATIAYATPTAATAGTYYIKGTSAAGCFDIKPVTVTVTASPTLVITNPPAACGTGTVDLTAAAITAGSTPGMTFTYWTNAAATIAYATPTAATAGTYYIKGALAGGCFDIKPVVVTTAPAPTVVITNPAPVCGTVDITAAAITAGSTAGLTFTYWTDAAATIPYTTPTVATAGTYYIKGTATAGCFDIKPVVVTTANTPTVTVTNPAPVCAPAAVDLTAAAITAGSTAGLTFTYWTDAAATIPYATPTVATAGTYYIKGTNAGNCFEIKPVVVTVNPLPTPVITGPAPVCQTVNNNTSTYSTPNVAGHTYNWVVVGGTIATGQGTSTITVNWTTVGAGSVSVTETITASTCSAPATKPVTVNPKPVTSPITHN